MHSTKLPAEKPLLTIIREPQSSIWIIELHNGEDNRLTHDVIDRALKPALDVVEHEWRESLEKARSAPKDTNAGKGALIIVGKRDQNKFFSNGLDYASAIEDPDFFPAVYNPLIARLLTFPIPVIAAINGHCFAGGLMLSLACDYRVMTDGKERRAWCCMNEVHFGAPWPQSMAAIARAKVSDKRTLRLLSLEGHRFSPAEALQHGLVDAVADGSSTDAVLAKARELASQKAELAKTGVFGAIKNALYVHTLEDFAGDEVATATRPKL